MKHPHLEENERETLKILKGSNIEISRSTLIELIKINLNKTYESLSWTLKNITLKDIIYFNPL